MEDYDKKTEYSGVWFFQNAAGMWRRWVLCCLRALLTGYGKDRTALRGRSLVVPRAPVHIRMGGAQLSGRILESGVIHMLLIFGRGRG